MSHDDLVTRLGSIEVLDRHGEAVRLATLWQGRTAVIALVRHFG